MTKRGIFLLSMLGIVIGFGILSLVTQTSTKIVVVTQREIFRGGERGRTDPENPFITVTKADTLQINLKQDGSVESSKPVGIERSHLAKCFDHRGFELEVLPTQYGGTLKCEFQPREVFVKVLLTRPGGIKDIRFVVYP